jgi:hypothetical protein
MNNAEQSPMLTWGYWSSRDDTLRDAVEAFRAGERAALCCLSSDSGTDPRQLLAYIIADIRNQGAYGDMEAGFISQLARKSLFGAKLSDWEPLAEHLTGEDRQRFFLGIDAAVADMADREPIDRLLPRKIMARLEAAIIDQDRSPEFAGYATAIVSAAVACSGN